MCGKHYESSRCGWVSHLLISDCLPDDFTQSYNYSDYSEEQLKL